MHAILLLPAFLDVFVPGSHARGLGLVKHVHIRRPHFIFRKDVEKLLQIKKKKKNLIK